MLRVEYMKTTTDHPDREALVRLCREMEARHQEMLKRAQRGPSPRLAFSVRVPSVR